MATKTATVPASASAVTQQQLPSTLRTCGNCANVLIFTYTCTSRDEANTMRDFEAAMKAGGDSTWQCICRACNSVQILNKKELVCSRDQLCKMIDTRMGLMDRILPAHPRPRQFGEAGKLTVDDLKAIMHR